VQGGGRSKLASKKVVCGGALELSLERARRVECPRLAGRSRVAELPDAGTQAVRGPRTYSGAADRRATRIARTTAARERRARCGPDPDGIGGAITRTLHGPRVRVVDGRGRGQRAFRQRSGGVAVVAAGHQGRAEQQTPFRAKPVHDGLPLNVYLYCTPRVNSFSAAAEWLRRRSQSQQ